MPQYAGSVYVDVKFDASKVGADLSKSLNTGAQAAAANTKKSLSQIGTEGTRVGRQVTFGLSAPLLGIGAAAVKSFTSFEESMTKITALAGVSAEQTAAWSDQVKQIGVDFGVGADQAAAALYYITSSGVEADQAMEVLRLSAQGSATGLGEVTVVADAVTSAMNAYGEENISAAEATDILTVAVREGKGEASELTGALANVVPIAQQLGVSYDQVAGSLASMTLSGTSADEGATQLRGVFTALLHPSTQARTAFEQVHLSVKELQDGLRTEGLVPTLQKISDAFDGDVESMGEVFPNVRGLTGVFNLLGEKTAQTNAILEQTANAAGASGDAMKVVAESPAHKLKVATEQLQTSLVGLGQAMIPMFTAVTEAAGKMLGAFSSLPGAAQGVVAGFIGFGIALGPVIYSVSSFISLIGSAKGILKKVGEGMDGLVSSSTRLGPALASGAQGASKLVSNLGLATVAAAGVAAAFAIIENKMADAREEGAKLGEIGAAANVSAAGASWEKWTEQINDANTGLATHNERIEELEGRPFAIWDPAEMEAMNAGSRALQDTGAQALKFQQQTQGIVDVTGDARTSVAAWIAEQARSKREFPDVAAAVAAYKKEVVNVEPPIAKAARTMGDMAKAAKPITDLFFAQQAAASGYRDALDKVVNANRDIERADRAVTSTQRDAANASRAIVTAHERQADAIKKIAEAQTKVKDAQKDLDEALKGTSEKLDVKDAQLSLKEAQATLRKGGFETPLERQRAQLAVERAKLALTAAQGAQGENVAKAQQALADARDGVTDAEKAGKDAAQGVKDAEQAHADAVYRVNDAQLAAAQSRKDLAAAEEAVLPAVANYATAQQDVTDALTNGNAQTGPFLVFLDQLKEDYPEVTGYVDKLLAKYKELHKARPSPALNNVEREGGGTDRRAVGGPVTAGTTYQVAERGMPELYTARGKTYMVPATGGSVVALHPRSGAAGGGPAVQTGDINIYEQTHPRQTAYEVRRELRKVAYLGGKVAG